METGRDPAGWLWQQIGQRLLIYGGFVLSLAIVLLVWRPQHAAWILLLGASVPLLDNETRGTMRRLVTGALGEDHVARLLAPLEAEGYAVRHDLPCRRGGNVDHLVVGPTGVFTIETKAWRGRVWPGKGRTLIRNGHDETRAVKQARREGFDIKERLARAGLNAYVVSVIALTNVRLQRGPIDLGSVHVLEAGDLPAFLRARRGRPIDTVAALEAILPPLP